MRRFFQWRIIVIDVIAIVLLGAFDGGVRGAKNLVRNLQTRPRHHRGLVRQAHAVRGRAVSVDGVPLTPNKPVT